MPTIQDIVQITVDVQSSSLTRVGFNSLLILALEPSFAVGWTEGTIKKYTSYQDVVDDPLILANSPAEHMAQVAFAQKPAVPVIYITIQMTANANTPSTALSAAAIVDNNWFGVTMDSMSAAAIDDATGWVASNSKYGFFQISSTTGLPTGFTSYSSLWYSPSSSLSLKWLACAAASRLLAYIPGSYTGAYKTLESVASSNPSTSDETILDTNHINYYPTVAGRAITYQGWAYGATSGFLDTYIGALYLEQRMAEDVFAVLAARTKVPYTNDGINLIVNAVTARLSQSVKEGYLTTNPPPVVSAPLAQEVNATDKSNRILPDITFTATTAGAIHTVQIQGTIIA